MWNEIVRILNTGEREHFSLAGDFLNRYAEKHFSLPAFYNPACSPAEIMQTLNDLKEVPFYQSEDALHSQTKIQQIADLGVEACLRMMEERNLPLPQTSTDELNRYFLRALIALQNHDWREALRSLLIYDSFSDIIFSSYPHLYFYRGLAWYGLQDYEKAEGDFHTYISAVPEDEIAHFYRGNTLYYLGRYPETVDEYITALQGHANFQEVKDNTSILEYKITGTVLLPADKICLKWQDSPFVQTLALPAEVDIWTIPIFINNFNRLSCLQKLVNWLVEAGYRNIYILDNDSSYPPLLEYYRQLEIRESAVQVLRLGRNFGHTALWKSGILESLSVESPYVYTDSDVMPVAECPKDFLQQFMDILWRYPLLKKVGLGLKTDGITCDNAEEVLNVERRYYIHEMEPNLYFSPVDTTFALYRNYRHYHLYVAARTTGKLMAWHLPWHYDYTNLPPDELYYAQHANASASLITALKKKNNAFQ
ncbi:Tetratricopeptide repeat-containing protein [Selenomonas ruminantium]|uniref:Tetratricopeptide repeat-containing protein n=1 Tax=Selenomonas ruminantium TaxID=971 RepID=A0A1M6ULE7_SELRU|nr:hypothetical protein [Selenomonas ruminantium]SHK70006.1 Tetratricopeptide repeat-containing protein [Selenomonas ruminantium]